MDTFLNKNIPDISKLINHDRILPQQNINQNLPIKQESLLSGSKKKSDDHDLGQKQSVKKEDTYIMSPVEEVRKIFLKEHLIIWYDFNGSLKAKETALDKFRNICQVKSFTKEDEVFKFIEEDHLPCTVITDESVGEKFIKQITSKSNESVSSVCIFFNDLRLQNNWTNKYKKVRPVKGNLQSFIKDVSQHILDWQRENPRFRTNFPVFSSIFNGRDKTDNNYLNIYLIGLLNFKNREQAKADFIKLARAVSSETKPIDEFEKNYNDYKKEDILKRYTQESYFYKLINNSLRVANEDSILYSRLPLKDLETAIKDQYQQKSKNFNGLLYRGTYLSDDEWKRLQENHGKDIEIYGFLSTSKDKDVATAHIQLDMKKKVFITVIVPASLNGEGQGFAELKDFSEYADEEEILFNIRSRFTILETLIEKAQGTEYRHLVLLYGGQEIKSFMRTHSPVIKLTLDMSKKLECSICSSKLKMQEKPLFFADLMDKDKYICFDCVKADKASHTPASVCVSKSLASNKDDTSVSIAVEGLVLTYQNELKAPFYGYKCNGCKSKEIKSYFVCRSCGDSKHGWCERCFGQENKCLEAGHLVVFESQPFTFWHQKLTENEKYHLEYKYDLLNQGDVLVNTNNFSKAVQFFEKYLKNKEEGKTNVKSSGTLYNNLSFAYLSLGQLEKAIQFGWKAIESYESDHEKSCPEISKSYKNLGSAYKELGEMKRALECYLKALEIDKLIHGERHPQTAISYGNLGDFYLGMGENEKAIDYDLKAKEIFEVLYGEKHPKTAISYNNLGTAYKNSGDLKKAIEFFGKALEANESLYGEKHPDAALLYNNLGAAHRELGEFKKAEQCHLKALEIYKLVFGERHPLTSTCYDNLGTVYKDLGNSSKASEYFLKAIEIDESMLGIHNPQTALAYSNLGTACLELGKPKEAVDYYSKAVKVQESVYGPKHPQTALTYHELGMAFLTLGKFKESLEYYEKGLAIMESKYGEKHIQTAILYDDLGTVYTKLGQLKKAEEYCLKAVKTSELLYGERHHQVAIFYSHLGTIHVESGQPKIAEQYYQKALKIREAVCGKNHLQTADSYSNLGVLYMDLGKFKEAMTYSMEALKIRKLVFGEKHPETGTSYGHMGTIYKELGELDQMLGCYEKAASICESVYGEKHPETSIAYNNLGTAYMEMEDLPKARNFFLKSLEINKTMYGEKHAKNAVLYGNMVELYMSLGNLKKAIDCGLKAVEINECIHGKNNPQTATSYGNLGAAYMQLGELDKAIEYNKKALAIDVKVYGEQNPETVASYSNLGMSYMKIGDWNKAAECNMKAAQLSQAIYGGKHPQTVELCHVLNQTLNGLANQNKRTK